MTLQTMNRFMTLCASFAALCGATMAVAETTTTQQTSVPGVQRVVVETAGDLEIRQGNAERLIVEADSDTMPHLVNTVTQDTLYLRGKGSFSTRNPIRYILEVPSLKAVTVRGSSDVKVDAFKGDSLDIELSGSSNTTLKDATFERLAIRVSGAGTVRADGRGETLSAEISGSGTIHAENFAVAQGDVKIAGSGDVGVNADKQLKVTISGAGSVRYKGKPEINKSIAGTGSVDPF